MKKLNELAAALREAKAAMEAASDENFAAAEREYKKALATFETAKAEAEAQREMKQVDNTEEQVREILASSRKQAREITFDKHGTPLVDGQISNSGAINLHIKDLVPNFEEGTVLPKGFNIATGVEGATLIPISIDDVEMVEAGEIEVVNDQTIDFTKETVTPQRITLSVDISNKAIDNKALPIMPVVLAKFKKAWRKFWAKKNYSQAAWAGVKGYFSGKTATATPITLDANFAKNILAKVAEFGDKGIDMSSLCLTMDAVTEARLKVHAIDPTGKNAGYVIQGGKLLGMDYTVSHYINTTLDEDNKLVALPDRYIGIGFYDYLIPQQHGEVRMTTDGTSKAMAKKNCVNLTFNTEVSLTSLSGKVYDAEGNAVETCALIKLVEPSK